MNSIRLNLLPYCRGQLKKGPKLSPQLILPYISKYKEQKNININYMKDINKYSNILDLQKYIINNIKTDSNKIINIGGDHSISVGTIPPMIKKYNNMKVLWIDAHADINNMKHSSTKNIHGMPLYYISELYEYKYPLLFENLMYIGLRDLDDYEKYIIDKYKIKYMSPENISIYEINKFIDNNMIHISLDFDSIDPTQFFCTGTTVINGIMINDLLNILSSLSKNDIVSIDMVEFNPLIGSEYHYNNSIKCIDSICKIII